MIEWEIVEVDVVVDGGVVMRGFDRTGRWRRRQYYAFPNDRRVPSDRTPCEWRTGTPR